MGNFYPAASSEITVKMKFLERKSKLEIYIFWNKISAVLPSLAPTSGGECRLSAVAWVPSPGGSHGNLLLGKIEIRNYQNIETK